MQKSCCSLVSIYVCMDQYVLADFQRAFRDVQCIVCQIRGHLCSSLAFSAFSCSFDCWRLFASSALHIKSVFSARHQNSCTVMRIMMSYRYMVTSASIFWASTLTLVADPATHIRLYYLNLTRHLVASLLFSSLSLLVSSKRSWTSCLDGLSPFFTDSDTLPTDFSAFDSSSESSLSSFEGLQRRGAGKWKVQILIQGTWISVDKK